METFINKNGKIATNSPAIGEVIDVYHPDRGGVRMVVTGYFGNYLECEFDGVEFAVHLQKVEWGDEKPGYRWQAERN